MVEILNTIIYNIAKEMVGYSYPYIPSSNCYLRGKVMDKSSMFMKHSRKKISM